MNTFGVSTKGVWKGADYALFLVSDCERLNRVPFRGIGMSKKGLVLASLLTEIIGNIFCFLFTDGVCRIPSSNISV